jgi:hypothetical protein
MAQDKQNAFAVMVGRIEDQLAVIPILTQNVLEPESAEWLKRFAANVAELIKASERAIAEAKAEADHPESVYDAVSRLRSWIRDYGDQKQPYFIADLKTVLNLISTEE